MLPMTKPSKTQEKVSPYLLEFHKKKKGHIYISAKKQRHVENSQIRERDLEETNTWATRKRLFRFFGSHHTGILTNTHVEQTRKTTLLSSLNAPVDDTTLEYPVSTAPITQPGAGLVQRAEKQSQFPFFSVQIKGLRVNLNTGSCV